MTALKPGDVVTDEPTEPGTVVKDQAHEDGVATLMPEGALLDSWATGRWEMSYCLAAGVCTGHSWAEILDGKGETVVRRVPEPAPAPAELWEPVTADQVRVGDHIEVTHTYEAGAICTFRGPVIAVGHYPTLAGVGTVNALAINRCAITIRRRVRTPMPEPDAPAVVQIDGTAEHPDGWLPARAVDAADAWRDLSGSGWIGTWSDVLALNPATDPVLVDLGGSA